MTIKGNLSESVDAASQPFQFVLDAELFFFERGDPDLVPVGVGHFRVDDFFEFSVLFGEFLYMPGL